MTIVRTASLKAMESSLVLLVLHGACSPVVPHLWAQLLCNVTASAQDCLHMLEFLSLFLSPAPRLEMCTILCLQLAYTI